jgi:hypothetical protein
MESATRSRKWLIACLYAAGLGIGAVLLVQHWVHLPVFLPYLFFLACPLMHVFMHGSHRGHSHHEPADRGKDSSG